MKAVFVGIGHDGVVLFWIADPHNGQGNVKSDVNLMVLRILVEAGVEIPYPQRVVHQAQALASSPS